MEHDFYTIYDTIDEIDEMEHQPFREHCEDLISFTIETARLTEDEMSAVNEMYAKQVKPEMTPLWKINCFFSTLRQSGLRPEQYWTYLLPPEAE